MSDKVKVWDLPTRLFHWSIVLLVLISWITVDNGWLELHLWSGLTLLSLLIYRVLWGIIGSTTARFSHFVATPRAALSYLKRLGKSDKPLYAGHNPAGGWMVLALLILLGIQVTTGLFANDDVHFNSPLSTLISKHLSNQLTLLHGMLFNIILAFVWIHVVAVFFYLCVKNENLVWPMVIGKKHRIHIPSLTELKFTSSLVALLLFGATGSFVWYILAG